MAAASEFYYGESLTESNPQYTPSTIRILTLLPRCEDSIANLPSNSSAPPRIRVEVHLVDLENLGSLSDYSALSYTWKPDNPKKTILVNGSPYSVGANLYSALCQLQPPLPIFEPRNLWVDAICINQDDAREKSHQISLMGQIYASAARGLSWLGPEADGSSLAFKHLERLNLASARFRKSRKRSIRDLLDIATTIGFNPSTWLPGILLLLGRDYWRRAWIRQEVVLSRMLYLLCGPEIAIFPSFLDAIGVVNAILQVLWVTDPAEIKALNFYSPSLSSVLSLGFCHEEFGKRNPRFPFNAKEMQAGHHDLSPEVPLETIIDELCLKSHYTCADPRDQILSLYGVFPESARSVVQFDHQTTAEDLCVRLAETLIRTCWNEPINAFRVLAFSQPQRKILPKSFHTCQSGHPSSGGVSASEESSKPEESGLGDSLPSWVPDWNQRFLPTFCGPFRDKCFNASSDISPVEVHLSPADAFVSPNILRVPIVHFDYIFGVGMICHGATHTATVGGDVDCDSAIAFFRRETTRGSNESIRLNGTSKAVCFKEDLPYGAPRTPSHDRAIAHTLVAGRLTSRKDILNDNDKHNSRSGPTEELAFRTLAYATTEEMDADLLDSYLASVYHVAIGRRPVLTAGRRIGMVPESAQPGDMLVVIIGAPVPFVVRPIHREGSKTNRHILIGECYIHGVMDGEVVKEGLEKMSFIELE